MTCPSALLFHAYQIEAGTYDAFGGPAREMLGRLICQISIVWKTERVPWKALLGLNRIARGRRRIRYLGGSLSGGEMSAMGADGGDGDKAACSRRSPWCANMGEIVRFVCEEGLSVVFAYMCVSV